MGPDFPVKTWIAPPSRPVAGLGDGILRRKPRGYPEWRALREWGLLPAWEEEPPGYLLRAMREAANLTQEEMGRHLGCSQQAIAQAERWQSNPTVGFLREWARAAGCEVGLTFERH